jgi:hypothetical protein
MLRGVQSARWRFSATRHWSPRPFGPVGPRASCCFSKSSVCPPCANVCIRNQQGRRLRVRHDGAGPDRPLLVQLRASCCIAANRLLAPSRLMHCSKRPCHSMTSSARVGALAGNVTLGGSPLDRSMPYWAHGEGMENRYRLAERGKRSAAARMVACCHPG